MMRTTGFPAAIVALMLARGQVALRGVFTCEHGINGPAFIEELRARGVDLHVTES
jgi:saccharopine dehydrogenase-like NADP-dependent oxidoreductase